MIALPSPAEPTLSAHHRKKQPEQVRRALLDCAAQIAAEQGAAAITIQAVAERAGVTKGGLLHHFDSKQALLAAVFSDLLEQMDREISADASREPMCGPASQTACSANAASGRHCRLRSSLSRRCARCGPPGSTPAWRGTPRPMATRR
jgi:AcrR family transcriptional regulator